jgi:hypothetical protein
VSGLRNTKHLEKPNKEKLKKLWNLRQAMENKMLK